MSKIKKCLIVDDEKSIRSVVGNILAEENCEVVGSVESAEAASEHLKENEVDVIFLDINLPGASGLALLKEIRKHNKKIKIVMMSGDATAENVTKAIEQGIDGFVRKPFTHVKIAEVLTRC